MNRLSPNLVQEMHEHVRMNWLDFGFRRSKVKGHGTSKHVKIQQKCLVTAITGRTNEQIVTKLGSRMHEHVRMNWLDFGFRRSKVKGHGTSKHVKIQQKYLVTAITSEQMKRLSPNLAQVCMSMWGWTD